MLLMDIESTAGFTGLRGRPGENMDVLVAALGLAMGPMAVRSDDHTDWCEERTAGCARPDHLLFATLHPWSHASYVANRAIFSFAPRGCTRYSYRPQNQCVC